ncbi:unnamed protein product [Effrenium voratum]|nr:unnamed protein product [Effrenium voratum]
MCVLLRATTSHRWSQLRTGMRRTEVVSACTPAGSNRFETLILSSYEGSWEEDQQCGEGSYKWSDGSSYEGNMEQGKMHGQGRFVWPDGSSYEGSWCSGALHGQGRFDSRFDGGRYMQGQFHFNCFQKSDGRWVDILQHMKNHELREILEGNPLRFEAEAAAARPKTKNKGSAAGSSAQVLRSSPEKLGARVREALHSNLVPFVLAEESAATHALESLLASGVTEAGQCISLRLAALEQRRQRDFKRFFRTALESSILSGSCFALVFEDDTGVGEEDWLQRKPEKEPMEAIPDEWGLPCFFSSSALPPEIFAPLTFNARGKARLLLPDGSDNGVPETAPEGDADESHAQPKVSQELLARAAASAENGVGATGHVFEVSEEELSQRDPADRSLLGLPLHYQVQPVVLATARIPELEDAEVRKWVKQRFGRVAPVHRMAIVLLSPEEQEAA